MTDFEFTDRYQALGIPYPDPATVCKGHCEGTGYVPVYMSEGDDQPRHPGTVQHADCDDPELVEAWRATKSEEPEGQRDGWRFVVCPRCKGSRLEPQQDGESND